MLAESVMAWVWCELQGNCKFSSVHSIAQYRDAHAVVRRKVLNHLHRNSPQDTTVGSDTMNEWEKREARVKISDGADGACIYGIFASQLLQCAETNRPIQVRMQLLQ